MNTQGGLVPGTTQSHCWAGRCRIPRAPGLTHSSCQVFRVCDKAQMILELNHVRFMLHVEVGFNLLLSWAALPNEFLQADTALDSCRFFSVR